MILNLLEELNEELNLSLQSDSVEVVTSLEELGEREPHYLLVQKQIDIPDDVRISSSRVLCFSSVDEVDSLLGEDNVSEEAVSESMSRYTQAITNFVK